MSTICMPKSILDKLDRACKSFLWESSVEHKKQHLVAWNKVTRPKSEGGLGIRAAQDMNKALVAKLGWRLFHDHDSLWVKLVKKNNKVGNIHDGSWLIKKGTWSSTWRSIASGLRDVVIPSKIWVLGNGRQVKFWTDRWLFNRILSEEAGGLLPQGYESMVVNDLWRDGNGWRMDMITPYVSDNARLELTSVVVDKVTGARDRLSWSESVDGNFSVKSAYNLLTRNSDPRPNLEKFYSRVWRVTAPERVRVFLWLVGNQVLMTNAERSRRHLSSTDVCPVCKGGVETILHILRDCPAMMGIWTRILPPRKRRTFFDKSLLEWVFDNLSDENEYCESTWATMFAMAVWWSWKWRCDNVFGNNIKCRDRTQFIKELARDVTLSHRLHNGSSTSGSRGDVLVGWVMPTDGWIKLKTDGASHGNPGLATAGGVLRDGYGDWCGGFSLNIGRCTAPLAELWGVYYGLYIAWEKKITRLELEVDSQLVVGFLKTGVSEMHPLSFLVRLCHGFLSRDWIVRISHLCREANRLADGLANYAFSLPIGFHFFDAVPNDVDSLFRDDVIGSTRPRRIRL
ncbi:Ribonuclease H-like superfamily [Arabidopsis thaliana x Arabidopsis arenosa]|uniref:Ribonuclease H-like superfamily n=1 Tax=Arabidopsis thaliana x Arabidopsis arenosa TaxID=1240361 RepID=A0A8T2C4Y5_9BRAS|nr:Ribonuclease H-like superfamily [Arabidopsis thaliana x Arabidopsis arenosa]